MRALNRWGPWLVVLAVLLFGWLRHEPAIGQTGTSCTTQSTTALLNQFADSAPNGSITPANIRNVVCSARKILTSGAATLALSPTISPFSYTALTSGDFITTSWQVQISRNGGTTYYTASLTGGQLSMNAGDIVLVTWFGSASVPTIVYMPDGQ